MTFSTRFHAARQVLKQTGDGDELSQQPNGRSRHGYDPRRSDPIVMPEAGRLDIDVDGPANSFVANGLVTKALPADHPRRSIWVRQATTARRESEGMLHVDMEGPAL